METQGKTDKYAWKQDSLRTVILGKDWKEKTRGIRMVTLVKETLGEMRHR